MRLKYFSIFSFIMISLSASAQIDSSLLRRIPKDTTRPLLNMDAVYNRPALQFGKLPVSLGGYVEANWQHITTDGVSEGQQFQFRRLSIFVSSSISRRIKFLAEVEFEPAESSVEVEFAAVDVEFHPLFNFRGGMVLNPIGAFNQNHDGPKWEFTDRPIAAVQMLPDTWSNAGFGLYGKYYKKDWMFGYEFYLTGGFNGAIIREIGLSYMGGVYNKWQEDGLILDAKRRCDVFDIDFNTTIRRTNTNIKGEWAWIFVDIPPTYTQQYGSKQHGGYMDIVQPVLKRRMLGWDNAVLNLACRLEYVDWNVGKFRETGGNIYDDVWSIMPAISFRPTSLTVFRLNYRYQKQWDLLGNPPATTAGLSFGLSTYF